MQTLERPGIDPRWLKSWKKDCSNLLKWREEYAPVTQKELELYTGEGSWFSLSNALSVKAHLDMFDIELAGMAGTPIEGAKAMRVFAAIYMHNVTKLYMHLRAETRGFQIQMMSATNFPFVAVGVVAGADKEVFRLTRALLAARRKQLFQQEYDFVISDLILRLLADFLHEPQPVLKGASLTEPFCNALFAVWRNPDPKALELPCLAVCDLHTRLSEFPYSKARTEFNNGAFTRTPIEILLVFKLRQKLGLPNPKLDHPLMNSPLGALPEEVPFDSIATGPDTLIYQVRSRMMQNGYDEEAICNAICS